jgi:hypothetical protein
MSTEDSSRSNDSAAPLATGRNNQLSDSGAVVRAESNQGGLVDPASYRNEYAVLAK